MRITAVLVAGLALASSTGCAALFVAAHAAELKAGSDFREERLALGPWEHRLEVQPLPAEPDAEELAQQEARRAEASAPEPEPLPPAWVPAPPAPGPPPPSPPVEVAPPPSGPVGPPYGTRPLQLSCTRASRSQRERVETHWRVWGFGEKALMGFIALWDGLVGAALLHGAIHEVDEPLSNAVALGAGALMLGDAAVLVGLIALMPASEQQSVDEVLGDWRQVQTGCPQGLALEMEGRTLPVDPAGQLDLHDEAWLVERLASSESSPLLVLGAQRTPLHLPPATRCELAAQRGLLLPAYCPVSRASAAPMPWTYLRLAEP